MTQQTPDRMVDHATLLDEQLAARFRAAGQAGVDPKEFYEELPVQDPSITHEMIYDALQRAKSTRRLGVEPFAPDPSRPGKIRYRLPRGDTN